MKGNCLIFGGGGFIGSHICDELIRMGYGVTVFDKQNFSKINIFHLKDKIRVIEGDFNNAIDLKRALEGIDYVFHLVSSTLPATSNENPVYDAETNLVSSLRLLGELKGSQKKKIIFISSGGTVYGIPKEIPIPESHTRNPLCSYGIIKKTIEDYLYMYNYLYGLDYVVLRLSNPYGERQNPLYSQGVIPVFLRKILVGEEIHIWGDGSVKRDYIYIKDAVSVIAKSVEYSGNSRIFNLGYGEGYTLNEIIKIMETETGKVPVVKYEAGRKLDVPVNVLDITLAKKTFGWKPKVTFAEGIKRTQTYIKDITFL